MSELTWAVELKPAITLGDVFEYAGHTMTVGIFEDETSSDVSYEIVSTSATPIEGGTYPKHFAEYEASEELSNEIISGKDSVDNAQDMANVIRQSVARIIARGVFKATLQATINDLQKKGATYREIQSILAKVGN
jgi:hypothetical protein